MQSTIDKKLTNTVLRALPLESTQSEWSRELGNNVRIRSGASLGVGRPPTFESLVAQRITSE